jgi:hypothetical protein
VSWTANVYQRDVDEKIKIKIGDVVQIWGEIQMQGYERHIKQQKYKTLRNRVTSALKRDTRMRNEQRIEKAANENEVWKIVNEMTNPKTETKWKLKDNDREINNDREIAEVLNHYFKNKIDELKANIG